VVPAVSPGLVDPLVPRDVAVVVPVVVLPVVLPVHGLELEEWMLRLGIVIVAPDARPVVCDVTLDDGTVIIGLTPALSISVEPSGMVPPPSNDPEVAPGVKSGEASPVEDTVADDPEVQALEDSPPPSKVVPAEAVIDCVIGELIAPGDELTAEVQGRGLKPPGSISVALSGMPVGAPDVGELSPLRGDVAPSPDKVGAFCA
jgi:hypothetical protein